MVPVVPHCGTIHSLLVSWCFPCALGLRAAWLMQQQQVLSVLSAKTQGEGNLTSSSTQPGHSPFPKSSWLPTVFPAPFPLPLCPPVCPLSWCSIGTSRAAGNSDSCPLPSFCLKQLLLPLPRLPHAATRVGAAGPAKKCCLLKHRQHASILREITSLLKISFCICPQNWRGGGVS